MTVHRLKSWPEFFEPLLDGSKTFELRKNDRDYRVGDHLLLQEYEPRTDTYTGREIGRRVSYVLTGAGVGSIAPLKGLAMGYAILGLEDVEMVEVAIPVREGVG